MRVYIESTIPSYVVARPARDLLQAVRQQLTKDWWDLKRQDHELFASQVVLDEIAGGDAAMARKRLRIMAEITLLRSTDEVVALTRRVLDSSLLPSEAYRDATHIALATVHEMDLLLTWNCRHIANGEIQPRLRRLVERSGFSLPALCTPEEMIGGVYE